MKPKDPSASHPDSNSSPSSNDRDLTGDLSGDLSTLFPGFDPDREKAVSDTTYEEVDPDITIRRDAVLEEEAAIPIFKNPLLKTGVVFAGVAILIGSSTALFLASSNLKPASQAEKPTEKKVEFENPTVANSQLKGQIALDKQNEMLKGEKIPAAGSTTPPVTPPLTKPETKIDVKPVLKPAKPKIEPVVVATPPTPMYKATPPTLRPIARSYPLPMPMPMPIYSAPKPAPRIRYDPKSIAKPSVVASAPKPILKPIAVASAPKPFTPVVLQSWQQQSSQGTFGGRSSLISSKPTSEKTDKAENSSPYLASEDEIYGLPGEPRKTISIGAKSLGIILSPVQIAAGDDTEQIITVGINQPVVDRDGRVVIPGASQVQFKVSVLDNGWLKATSTKAYVNGQEIGISGNFALTTEKGTPLIAESLQFGEDIISRQDQKNFIFGALQNVGKVLTQPDTTSSTTAGVGGISTSSSSKSKPNVIGAILDGGFSPLATQQMTRSTAEINRLLNATRMWYLPVGTTIKITAVQSLKI